ncbi:MAG: hypothetical protein COU09_02045 [Candidatus Harrisonbacteria bacterium CG10_big_fil_rev_8_21_14_0_10_44_23]|uniref:Uncharacterized protein n=1 Tax=Candidatus Harrisonbacteria bacterium CG10_big_fil_rev_8_21_14_0_10_44_23 TaxID=1974585 RepID=A0A2H0UPX1_9BACT|nr:MAG: hypothetical protein COU09_02045 [Candidatus Harrisonbacteria bacterium CG10_big_fil_rev_8_21_14_0_10_44_23]
MDQAKKVLEKIKNLHLRPQSKLVVRFKQVGFWVLGGILILLGALFFSIAMLAIFDVDPRVLTSWNLAKLLRFMLLSAPYFWLFLLLVVGAFGFLAIRKTKGGYRYRAWAIVTVVVLLMAIFGTVAHAFKINLDSLEIWERQAPPFLQRFAPPRMQMLHHPEEGALPGRILEFDEDGFELESVGGKIWKIEAKDSLTEGLEEEDAVILFGDRLGEDGFEAEFISRRPFGPRGGANFHNEERSND